MQIRVDENSGIRLDVFLTSNLPELSRARIQALLKSGDILVNDEKSKPKSSVNQGDIITIHIPAPESEESQPEDLPLEIIHEDDHVIVLNKASGMVVHPANGNRTGTLVNALLHHCNGKLAPCGGAERPGIVHRLDKDTSGCIVVAKTDQAHQSLVKQFAERETKKQYLAVVQGIPIKQQDTVFTNIGRHPVNRLKMAVVNPGTGKSAITDYQVLGTDSETNTSLVLCDIHTGRTHQIRVHMVHVGSPILADPIYAKTARQTINPGRLMLHARFLSFIHPESTDRVHFTAPIPQEFTKWTDQFHIE